MTLEQLESELEKKVVTVASSEHPAHDLLHFRRVVKMAKFIAQAENARMDVVVPAAWLHDLVIVPKNDPRRAQASRLSSAAARGFLNSIPGLSLDLEAISHAIEAHSFSAKIEARTLEAKIVQDADRLDGLGAIGVARCFATAGLLRRPFYAAEDPFCESRMADDGEYTIDHFYVKLFKTAETLQTAAGRAEGLRRVESMKSFLGHLRLEIL